jgi:16S rRNA (guanine1207-N2)-methyltransferase
MDMTDSNALALSATRATLQRNQLEAGVFASDGLKSVDGRYDLIISNPPFHAGHRERDDLGAGVFERVKQVLEPGGQLVLVANRHLPWRRWLDDTFGGHTLLAANRAYHVLTSRH